jgi:hypothetical protein
MQDFRLQDRQIQSPWATSLQNQSRQTPVTVPPSTTTVVGCS